MFRILNNIKIPQIHRRYHEKIIEYYENPRNVGSFNSKDKDIGTGLVGAPACGDVMKIQIKVDDSCIIVDAKIKTFGCGSAIASSSYSTEFIKGKNITEALMITAIKAAINDYKKK